MLYPVILAGGIGKRLWPVSNQTDPKQFKTLLGKYTLLQKTYQRILQGFDKQNIFVVTTAKSTKVVEEQIDIAQQNILAEPMVKGTAMAIGYAASKISALDPEASMVVVYSDHYIKKEHQYLADLKKAEQIIEANPQSLLLFGVKPAYPETGYGYIKFETLPQLDHAKVLALKEKPDLPTAQSYISSGDFLWSPGVFVFKVRRLLELYKQYLPAHYQALLAIGDGQDAANCYQSIENISIDYGLLEKMDDMIVLPVDYGWADIGHWRSLRDIQLSVSGRTNVTNSQHVLLDSQNNLLYSFSDKLIATIGIEDMILVETDKVIFLCPASRAQEVKKLLTEINAKNLDEYL